MRRRNLLKVVMMMLALAEFPAVARADFGALLSRAQWSLSVQEEYSNNIDLTPRDEIADFITTITPGIRISTFPRSPLTREFQDTPAARAERYGIDFNYRPGFVFYAKETQNNFVSHL